MLRRNFPQTNANCRNVRCSIRGHNKPFSMGGDHGHNKPSLPDWRQWKWQGTPLEFTQQRLKARGLTDPWARNEAWRYSGDFARAVTISEVFLRGFKWGFAAFTVAVALEYALYPPKKGGH